MALALKADHFRKGSIASLRGAPGVGAKRSSAEWAVMKCQVGRSREHSDAQAQARGTPCLPRSSCNARYATDLQRWIQTVIPGSSPAEPLCGSRRKRSV